MKRTRVSETILVDTGFWIALFDPQQAEHENARAKADYVELATLIVPWPTLYETLRTRFVRRPDWVTRFDERLKKPSVKFIDDGDYRQEAYSLVIESSRRRPISMVDMLCRLLIDDPNVRIDYLLTTNPRDFADVCRQRGVTLL